jgi:hypothetical protein
MKNETNLLIAMLREAWTYHGDDQLSAPEYLKRYGHLINGAGQFLIYLGLAQPDRNSDLGWRPTPLLDGIVARKATRP